MISIKLFIVFVPILGTILLLVNFILAPHKPYKEKKTPFECGYHSFLFQNRTEFNVSFFLFGILFMIFDLEIINITPAGVSLYYNDIFGLGTVLAFIAVLGVGFIFELGKGALVIESKQDKILMQNRLNFGFIWITLFIVITIVLPILNPYFSNNVSYFFDLILIFSKNIYVNYIFMNSIFIYYFNPVLYSLIAMFALSLLKNLKRNFKKILIYSLSTIIFICCISLFLNPLDVADCLHAIFYDILGVPLYLNDGTSQSSSEISNIFKVFCNDNYKNTDGNDVPARESSPESDDVPSRESSPGLDWSGNPLPREVPAPRDEDAPRPTGPSSLLGIFQSLRTQQAESQQVESQQAESQQVESQQAENKHDKPEEQSNTGRNVGPNYLNPETIGRLTNELQSTYAENIANVNQNENSTEGNQNENTSGHTVDNQSTSNDSTDENQKEDSKNSNN